MAMDVNHARKPDVTIKVNMNLVNFAKIVILTQPEGRVQFAPKLYSFSIAVAFQSSPSPKAGCNTSAVSSMESVKS